MSVRDVMAEAIWLYEREIAGAPLPHPSWATFKANDPETAMIYETHAGSVDAALRAAGYAVVPVEATEAMLPDAWRMVRQCGGQGVDHDCLRAIYRAMIAATKEPDQAMAATAKPHPSSAPE